MVAMWSPCVAMLSLSFISLMDRSILSILSPVILRDLHLSGEQYGVGILVFSICYMFANPVWGLSMDRIGLVVSTSLAVGMWSLASGAHLASLQVLQDCVSHEAFSGSERVPRFRLA